MLWNDRRFLWLLAAAVLVAILEFFSLAGMALPPAIAIPLFLVIILAIGHQTLYKGLQALLKLNFKSIKLLMLVATCGAFYLEKYEEAAVVIVLYTLAERLEDIGIAKSKSSLESLIDQMPREVMLKGRSNPTVVQDVTVGDIMLIKPGSMIPLDGTVIEGNSSIDESTITGEPIPQDKHLGDPVFAGTLNLQGYMEVKVSKKASSTVLAKIQELTFQATKTKATTQRFIETFSSYYTPSVIALALFLSIVPPFVWGYPFQPWFLSALTLLVISCPCALVISTPISIYSAIGNASSRGVLIKGGRYLEVLGSLQVMAFDKTRTLTVGRPHVTDVIPLGQDMTPEELLSCAAGIEKFSEHPLSQSIVQAAQHKKIDFHAAQNFESVTGKGVKADCMVCEDSQHCIGKLKFILEEHQVPENVVEIVDRLQKEGKTAIVISTQREVEGVIALEDEIRPDSAPTIDSLHRMGIQTLMLTGDHSFPAHAVAAKVGIDEVKAELLPQDKADVVRGLLQKYSSVGMLGDGVNDAPALALSTVGITMSSLGSDVAIETASVVILSDNLEKLPQMVRLGRRTMRIIRFNTFWAVMVKLVFIALAMGGGSNLAMAIFADVGVTVLVILNSLRLLRS